MVHAVSYLTFQSVTPEGDEFKMSVNGLSPEVNDSGMLSIELSRKSSSRYNQKSLSESVEYVLPEDHVLDLFYFLKSVLTINKIPT
jgi:hypothetical protein